MIRKKNDETTEATQEMALEGCVSKNERACFVISRCKKATYDVKKKRKKKVGKGKCARKISNSDYCHYYCLFCTKVKEI